MRDICQNDFNQLIRLGVEFFLSLLKDLTDIMCGDSNQDFEEKVII